MVKENFIEKSLESGEEVEDGLIWDTYMLPDTVVQIPREDDEWRIDRIEGIYNQLSENVPAPEIQNIRDQGIEFERIEGEMLRDLKNRLENISEVSEEYEDLRGRYLDAVELAGQALAYIHNSEPEVEGYGYFKTDGETTEAPHDIWREYVGDELIEREDVPEEFERAADLAFQNFELDKVPENPPRGILHDDYNTGNIMVREGGSIAILDFDNAIYGDPDFGYLNSKMELCDHDDKEAQERFRKGYESARELDISNEKIDNYTALAVLKSVSAGKWVKDNRDVDFLEEFAENVTRTAKNYFR